MSVSHEITYDLEHLLFHCLMQRVMTDSTFIGTWRAAWLLCNNLIGQVRGDCRRCFARLLGFLKLQLQLCHSLWLRHAYIYCSDVVRLFTQSRAPPSLHVRLVQLQPISGGELLGVVARSRITASGPL